MQFNIHVEIDTNLELTDAQEKSLKREALEKVSGHIQLGFYSGNFQLELCLKDKDILVPAYWEFV